MIIRKSFTLNNAHIVRNCYSDRCKYSLHAHTAIIEAFFRADHTDKAGMVMDFGITKLLLKPFLDIHRDAVLMWSEDSKKYKEFIKNKTDNWIELGFTPSAELLSAYFVVNFDNLISRVRFANGEDDKLELIKVRYHETRTGWAESDKADAMAVLMEDKWPLIINSMGSIPRKKVIGYEEKTGINLFSSTPIAISQPKIQVSRDS